MHEPRSIWEADAFLHAFAEWYFPGGSPAYMACEGTVVRGLLQRGRACSTWHFRTDLEAVPAGAATSPVSVPLLRDVSVAFHPVGSAPAGSLVAPLVQWGAFDSWESYTGYLTERSSGASLRTLRKKARRIERALGELRFEAESGGHAELSRLIAWKNAQLTRRGEQNRYSVERNQRFLHELLDRGLFWCATLRAGDALLAGVYWARAGGRMTVYLSAFDAELAYFSPGALILERLLRYSHAAGDAEFDFMAGLQPQKLAHATHLRELVTLGREPLRDRTKRVARQRAGQILLRVPELQRRARSTEAAIRSVVGRRPWQ